MDTTDLQVEVEFRLVQNWVNHTDRLTEADKQKLKSALIRTEKAVKFNPDLVPVVELRQVKRSRKLYWLEQFDHLIKGKDQATQDEVENLDNVVGAIIQNMDILNQVEELVKLTKETLLDLSGPTTEERQMVGILHNQMRDKLAQFAGTETF